MPAILDANPQIDYTLKRIRQQLRDAIASGETGTVHAEVPYFTKRIGVIETYRSIKDNLTSISGKS